MFCLFYSFDFGFIVLAINTKLLTRLRCSWFLQTSEYIIQAYKYGAFEKIPEFIAFRNRLNHSLHFAQVRTERMLLDLFLDADMLVLQLHLLTAV